MVYVVPPVARFTVTEGKITCQRAEDGVYAVVALDPDSLAVALRSPLSAEWPSF